MPKQNGAEIARKLRRMRVLQGKVAGASVRQLAEQEDISVAQVQKDVQRVLGELAREHIGAADTVRGLQMERYNQLLLRWYPAALNRDENATNIVLKILDKISMIHGVIPDKATIQLQQNSFISNDAPVTFVIESPYIDYLSLSTPQTVLEEGRGDILS